jgi:hypothetical protein
MGNWTIGSGRFVIVLLMLSIDKTMGLVDPSLGRFHRGRPFWSGSYFVVVEVPYK